MRHRLTSLVRALGWLRQRTASHPGALFDHGDIVTEIDPYDAPQMAVVA
ncbi:MAG: hypothetical protein ACJ79A_20580 [Gemmatimonadaceae bacterium]